MNDGESRDYIACEAPGVTPEQTAEWDGMVKDLEERTATEDYRNQIVSLRKEASFQRDRRQQFTLAQEISDAAATIEKQITERDRLQAELDACRDDIADFIVEQGDCIRIALDMQNRHYLEVLIAQWREKEKNDD